MTARPALRLRAEAAVLIALIVTLYARLDASWWLFATLALAPDPAAIGYFRGPRPGATTDNLAHWAVLPALLALVAVLADYDLPLAVALVWFAHIAIDRLLGYGLKYPTTFKESHVQRV